MQGWGGHQNQMNKEKLLGSLAVILGASFYGLMSPIVKGAYNDGHTFEQVTLSQFFYASLFFLPYFLWQMRKKKVSLKKLWHLLLIGILGLGGTSLFYYGALQYLPASLALILLFQFVWIGVLLEWIFYRKVATPYHLLAVFIVIVGTFFTIPLNFEKGGVSFIGMSLGLAAALSYSLFLNGTSHLSLEMDGGLRSAFMVFGSLVVLTLFFLSYVPPEELNPLGNMLGWGLLLGLLGQVFPPLLFSYGAPKIGGALTSLFGSVELPVGILAAYLILREEILPVQWIGILLILSGILLSQLEPFLQGKGRKPTHQKKMLFTKNKH